MGKKVDGKKSGSEQQSPELLEKLLGTVCKAFVPQKKDGAKIDSKAIYKKAKTFHKEDMLKMKKDAMKKCLI